MTQIKVGFIGPISGFYALQGNDMLNCTQLALDEVNAAGGAAGRETCALRRGQQA